ncbi:MAG: hypothetical protein OEX12_12700 [Gammaproteobacteria bacterium]|nr:hypothetical protein [Gammaproteobacteria bacterium]
MSQETPTTIKGSEPDSQFKVFSHAGNCVLGIRPFEVFKPAGDQGFIISMGVRIRGISLDETEKGGPAVTKSWPLIGFTKVRTTHASKQFSITGVVPNGEVVAAVNSAKQQRAMMYEEFLRTLEKDMKVVFLIPREELYNYMVEVSELHIAKAMSAALPKKGKQLSVKETHNVTTEGNISHVDFGKPKD